MYTVRHIWFCRVFIHVDNAFFGGHAPKNDAKRHLRMLLVATNQYFDPAEGEEVFEIIAQKRPIAAQERYYHTSWNNTSEAIFLELSRKTLWKEENTLQSSTKIVNRWAKPASLMGFAW